ncbi:MAG: radical SAM family heme chaperone HemW, partial [Candidatus Omnitrophota bacterium]
MYHMAPSLYIHIPFCRRKCVYCDFYSVIPESAIVDPYIDILSEQIKNILAGGFRTIYIGGGTPTALNITQLRKLLNGLEKYSKNIIEFTIEANPESFDVEKAKLFLDSGINRISIGFQSVREEKLKKLGRIHTAHKAEEAVVTAGAAGFKNISIDLIFGLWNERPEDWKKELEHIVRLDVTHVSCYALTYEKRTPLFNAVKNKSIVPLDDDVAALMYETAIDSLALRGFKQYEISSFAKAGFECAHNMNYWENNPYIGLGAAAVSYLDGRRSKNISDV